MKQERVSYTLRKAALHHTSHAVAASCGTSSESAAPVALTFSIQPSSRPPSSAICGGSSTRGCTQVTFTFPATWSMTPSIRRALSAFMSRNSTPSTVSFVRSAIV